MNNVLCRKKQTEASTLGKGLALIEGLNPKTLNARALNRVWPAAAVIVGLLSLAAGRAAAECAAGKTFKARQVCGQVRDSWGSPIPKATIQLKRPGAKDNVAETESDADGNFLIPEEAFGDYELHVTSPSYTDVQQSFFLTHPKKDTSCSSPMRVIMVPEGNCSYVENAKKDD
jgi:Carboxypeptidase regulatory-like domain